MCRRRPRLRRGADDTRPPDAFSRGTPTRVHREGGEGKRRPIPADDNDDDGDVRRAAPSVSPETGTGRRQDRCLHRRRTGAPTDTSADYRLCAAHTHTTRPQSPRRRVPGGTRCDGTILLFIVFFHAFCFFFYKREKTISRIIRRGDTDEGKKQIRARTYSTIFDAFRFYAFFNGRVFFSIRSILPEGISVPRATVTLYR